nr:hypothetical protein [Flavisolibacter sp.]
PFWSIEGTRDSQLVFRLAEWETSRSFAMLRSSNANGSRIYEALNDSSSITLTILPRFCSDGMSDFIYPKMFQVVYNQQTYMGCGVIYR